MQFDDEDEAALPRTPTAHSRFDLGDAFSDTDDNEEPVQFSAEVIRKDIERSRSGNSWQGDDDKTREFAAKIGFSVEPNASVSTLDMNASPPPLHRSLSDSSETPSQQSEQGSFYDVQLSSPMQDSSLSDDPPFPPQPKEQEEYAQHDVAEDHVADYPAVQIDVSEPERISVEVKSTPIVEEDSSEFAARAASSHDESRSHTPVSHRNPRSAVSTSSLPQMITVPHSTTSQPDASPTPTRSQPPIPGASTTSFHKPARSMGPSILDKVVSKTRPNFLPPKNRREDQKHLHDWEAMMKRSRAAEEKRRKALQQRRFERERQIEESLYVWEHQIVPDWTVVHRSPKLRRLWWQGIPTKLRATMWQSAVGNALVLSKDSYKSCLARARKALASGSFPTTVLGLIEEDIATTLPSLQLFNPQTGPMSQDLKDMLCAWTVSRSDESLGYVPGVAKICAMLLINMSAPEGFVVMRNMLERHCLRSFYGGLSSKDDVRAYYRIFDTLLADGMPKIYFNFKQHQVSPEAYLPDWLIPLFLNHLPFEACARIWDIILLEGDSFLYRAALAILAVLEPRLFFPDKNELLELLRGENKAALDVAKRDGLPQNSAKYEIYGVDEETLWERIDSMDEWWRESTWTRLIQRELPDL